jgi:hypothetical protein
VKDKRKNVKVDPVVKDQLTLLKKDLGLKVTESHVLAYLLAMYNDQKQKIVLSDHQRYLKESEDIHIQK